MKEIISFVQNMKPEEILAWIIVIAALSFTVFDLVRKFFCKKKVL